MKFKVDENLAAFRGLFDMRPSEYELAVERGLDWSNDLLACGLGTYQITYETIVSIET
jgi:hypothetical protein